MDRAVRVDAEDAGLDRPGGAQGLADVAAPDRAGQAVRRVVGQGHGVIVAVQQHNDFLKTAAETIQLIDAVGSDWFSCILDIGSLRSGDPYAEIQKLVPYAVSWQIKEEVGRNGKSEPTDLTKIKAIIDQSGYRGYLPFEALDSGDPQAKIIAFLGKIRRTFAA